MSWHHELRRDRKLYGPPLPGWARDQLWVRRQGCDPPEREKFIMPTTGEERVVVRKPNGGMWTSTYRQTDDGHMGSSWTEWCQDAQFGDAEDWWLLKPDPKSRVYIIDTLADLENLIERYCWEPPLWARNITFFEKSPAWENVMADYDAVHLTEGGQWRTRLTYPVNLYGWDCECTLWLRWKFLWVLPRKAGIMIGEDRA